MSGPELLESLYHETSRAESHSAERNLYITTVLCLLLKTVLSAASAGNVQCRQCLLELLSLKKPS